jgi:hypothetical protein
MLPGEVGASYCKEVGKTYNPLNRLLCPGFLKNLINSRLKGFGKPFLRYSGAGGSINGKGESG